MFGFYENMSYLIFELNISVALIRNYLKPYNKTEIIVSVQSPRDYIFLKKKGCNLFFSVTSVFIIITRIIIKQKIKI